MNADGSGLAQLTQAAGPAGRPAWSPDGARIAFDCEVEAGNTDICSMAADGTDLVRLNSAPGWDVGPAYSPDGTKIAFGTQVGWDSQVAIMNVDGSGTILLPAYGYSIAWSADGTRLAVSNVTNLCEADGRLCYDTLRIFTADGTYLGFIASGASPTWASVRLTARPNPRFHFTCSALDCTFDSWPSWDLGATIAGFSWDFGDGVTASGATASHTFADPGPHTVTLTATDDVGVTGAHAETVTVVPNVPPVAAFTSACTGLACVFNASATSDSDGWIAAWSWDFGDGATASGFGPYYHAFAAPGTYTVSLTVTDDHGATDTHSQAVRAGNAPPSASFTANCTGWTCSFDGTASADSDGTIAGYQWDFGDGAVSTGATATHAYMAGQHTVTLTVTDNEGAMGTRSQNVTAVNASPVASFTVACNALTCSFDASASSDSDGTVEHYGWNFGDGTVAPGVTLTHTYAAAGHFTVILNITDNGGASGFKMQTITVDTPPVASFTASCSAVTCSFNGSASSDPDGTIAAYAWTFGDGTTGSGASPSHSYATGGSFTVTLTVTDNLGATGTQSQTVTAVNTPPVASFTSSCAAVTCGFNASASADPDGTIATYAWTFGDGTTGTQSQTVTAVNTPPVASFTSSCAALTCSFNGSASSDADGTIASYAWTFGDGTIGSGASPSHSYTTDGTFTVTLTVTDNLGAAGTRSGTVTVSQTHVGDLDGRSTIQGSSWTATVTVTVHASDHTPVASATVTGSWTGGATSSCTSNASGVCVVTRAAIPGGTRSVAFTVTGIAHASMTYKAAANHDPDGDSNGTSIVVNRH